MVDAGIEAAHWSTLGVNNAPDSEIMAYANVHDYVVLTHDLDFGAILAATHGEKPSVVQIRAEDVSPGVIGKQVIEGTDGRRHGVDAAVAPHAPILYACWRWRDQSLRYLSKQLCLICEPCEFPYTFGEYRQC